MLLVVVFAQGILAAHACVAPSAVQDLSISVSDDEAMPCHVAEKIISNTCLMHCSQSDQVALDPHAMSAVPVNDIVMHVALPQQQQKISAPVYAPVVLNTGPPLSIRFCSFLI